MMESAVAVYLAYQGDVNDFQAVHVSTESLPLNDDAVKLEAAETMRACLRGWFAANGRFGSSLLSAVPSGFVCRITESGWVLFEVSFSDDSLESMAVVQLDEDIEIATAPTGLPEFFFQSGAN